MTLILMDRRDTSGLLVRSWIGSRSKAAGPESRFVSVPVPVMQGALRGIRPLDP